MEDVTAHFVGKGKDKEHDRIREPLFTFANSLNAIRDTVCPSNYLLSAHVTPLVLW